VNIAKGCELNSLINGVYTRFIFGWFLTDAVLTLIFTIKPIAQPVLNPNHFHFLFMNLIHRRIIFMLLVVMFIIRYFVYIEIKS